MPAPVPSRSKIPISDSAGRAPTSVTFDKTGRARGKASLSEELLSASIPWSVLA